MTSESVQPLSPRTLAANDLVTVEVIRTRADEPWLSLRDKGEHYREDVRFLLDRIEELSQPQPLFPQEPK